MKSALDAAGTIAVIVAAGVVVWAVLVKPPDAPAARQQVEEVDGLSLDKAHIRHVVGSGRIAIVEFSDFQCPYCRKHATEILPAIKRELVESGRIRYVVMHNPLNIHPLAVGASEAAECAAAQGHFWEMYDRLFNHPNALMMSDLLQHAQALGLNEAGFDECLTSHETLEKVRADLDEGRRLGVTGTPAFFIGTVRADGGIEFVTRIRGTVDADVFAQQIANIN